MKKVIELIQAEIKKLEDDNPKETSWNDIGIIQGLEKAIELIEVQAAMKDIYVITAGTSGVVVESYEDEEEAMLACKTLDEERQPTKHHVTKTKLVCS